MPTRLSRLSLYICTSRRQRRESRNARKAGNAYRDRGEWAQAASSYAHYLKIHRSDFAIWVQLGHMLKEAKRLEEADNAYTHALALRPKDGDLLLSLGHLRKRQGRLREAANFYRQSIRANGSSDAFDELQRLPIGNKAGNDEREEERDARTEKAIAARTYGIQIVKALGIIRDGTGHRFHLNGLDPQLHFELKEETKRAPVVLLELHVQTTTDFKAGFGTLFLDYGAGFQPHEIIRLPGRDEYGSIIKLFIAAPQSIACMRWDPVEGEDIGLSISTIRAIAISTIEQLMALVDSDDLAQADHSPDFDTIRAHIEPFFTKPALTKADADAMQPVLPPWRSRADNYPLWLALHEQRDAPDYEQMRFRIQTMSWKPRFSFVMPTFNTPISLLREILDAMLGQNYPYFEICIADDCSSDPDVLQELDRYAAADARVKVARREYNGHISLASNTAAELATGDFIVLIDHDDLIPHYALFVIAAYINRFPDARILFSDEDKIDLDGNRSSPYFKSCYNQFLMYGHNMISHLGVYQRDLFNKVGGFRQGLEGSQDYDLFLRCSEKINPQQIVHIPHILYHWRQAAGSTALSVEEKNYATVSAQQALSEHFERLKLPLSSVDGHAPGNNAIVIRSSHDTLISIIIYLLGNQSVLEDCLTSIAKAQSGDVEILIVGNESRDPKEKLASLQKRYPSLTIRTIFVPNSFNLSQAKNFAASLSHGTILCFLDEDLEIRTPGWLSRARGLLEICDVGVVGARLLNRDGTLRHFGLVTGMHDHQVAGHVHLGQKQQSFGYFSKHRMIAEFSAVSGACLFITKQDFDDCGGFATNLSLVYEDVDLCLKMRAMNRRILCDPGIELVGRDAPNAPVETRNTAPCEQDAKWMRRRWAELLPEDPYYSPNLSLDRPDFAYAYPPRQAWPWHDDDRGRPAVAPGRNARAPRYFARGQKRDGGNLAICAILKNESEIILEWIAYHHALGVEKFYLYDNNSTDGVQALLDPLVEVGLVDLIPWPINPGQVEAYDDFADRHGYQWTWTAFIDLDEFINPFAYESISEWLNNFTNASAIALQWLNFGPNGHDDAPPGLILEAYTSRLPDRHGVHGHVKTIVRMADYGWAISPHSFHVDGRVVDEHGMNVDQCEDYAIIPVRDHQAICINHYYTRSRNEWRAKVAKGLADHALDTKVIRDPEWLGIYEREAIVHDDRILKFAKRTRQMLSALGLPTGQQFGKAGQQ